jgi:hypothetical protein
MVGNTPGLTWPVEKAPSLGIPTLHPILRPARQSFSDVQVRVRVRKLHFGLGLSLFVCLRIYTVKKSTFHKKIPKFQFFLS